MPALLCPSPVTSLEWALRPGAGWVEGGVIPTGDKGCFHFWVAELQLCQVELSHIQANTISPSAFFPRLLEAPHVSSQMTANLKNWGGKEDGKGRLPGGVHRETSPQRAVKLLALRCQNRFPIAKSHGSWLTATLAYVRCSQLSTPTRTATQQGQPSRTTSRTHSPDRGEQRVALCD